MPGIDSLFANNRAWAAARERSDPGFFQRLCAIQRPDYLWIGCADSRVPANEIVGLDPGELFVHRNVANIVPPGDVNALSVIQYAIDVLKVEHIIVTGHYGCGGVLAAFADDGAPPLGNWVDHVRRVRDAHAAELAALPDHDARWRRLCELNVAAQVRAVSATPLVQAAWARGQPLAVHGWVYDLRDGLLRNMNVSVDGAD
ncbi:MAG TPA: carbonic anhydrase [Burkholderiales bacterium]|nr:carbonic anhydrase [Burkholderiales bacterium]